MANRISIFWMIFIVFTDFLFGSILIYFKVCPLNQTRRLISITFFSFTFQYSGPDESIETTAERRTSDDILNKYCSPLKSTEIFKDITATDKKPVNNNEKENQQPQQQSRKISFTTEKTIMVNMNDNEKPSTKKADQAKFRKVSIDINYVYEQQQESKPSRMNIHDEKLNDNETGNCQI